MAETENTANKASNSFSKWNVKTLVGPDIVLPIGIVVILCVLLIPLPTWLLDISLALSISFSFIILMTVIFIQSPKELSSFPTILLIATMIRLSLNVASTRLILSEGHTGTNAAGEVIKAFGGFIAGGNYVIGIILFAILVIINFIVITKGAGRIAEVAARFTLDAMPGKQMAIDADLSSGLLSEDEAKQKRKDMEGESAFFGAMDGASKFVRGDAIAGLLITFINIIGGIIIGVVQLDMEMAAAAENYTLLTIGDGLVSQIPALVISVAAGMLVTKAGVEEKLDSVLFGQIAKYPTALGIASGLLFFIALVPNIPAWPFLIMSIATGALAFHLRTRRLDSEAKEVQREIEQTEAAEQAPPEEPISSALQMDLIRLELGYGLLPMINSSNEQRLTDQIKALRRQLAQDMGFVMPAVRIQDNLQLPSNTYVIRIKEIEVGRGDLRPNMLMIMDPMGGEITIKGEATTEPTFGLPAMWIQETNREEATFQGYTVVDSATVITTHITELIKDNMDELLSYGETRKLLDELPETQQKLVEDLVPNQINMGAIQRILQNLLTERVSIRDLSTILEGISEALAYSRNATHITEHVRARLARQICDYNANPDGVLSLVTLSPEWEQAFAEALVDNGEEKQLAMPPSQLQEFVNRVKTVFEEQAVAGETPVLLVSPMIRPYVRSVIQRFRPITVVMSQNEIHPKAKIKTVEVV